MKKTTVVIADDHAVVRMGLSALLNSTGEFSVVGEADTGESAVRQTLKLAPDITIMDLMMPKMDGAAATAEILRVRPESKIVILTTFGMFKGVGQALEYGARGALLKNIDNDLLIASLSDIAAGRRVISADIRRTLRTDPPPPELSDRQQEVLDLVARGKMNAEIAATLGVREDSVKKLVVTICKKLGASNRAEAVAIAMRKHLLKAEHD